MNNPSTTQERPAQTQRVNYVTPLANILEGPEGYDLELEMPGVNREGLEVTVDKGVLTLIGRRTQSEQRGREIFRESRRSDYRRMFELDPSIAVESITARIEQGLVHLHLPKSERVKPRKIEVA